MQVRQAEPADAVAIAALTVRSHETLYRYASQDDWLGEIQTREERWLTKALVEGSSFRTTVALVATSVVGFAILGPVRDSDLEQSTICELYGFYLQPNRISTGLAVLLMDDALKYLRSGPWTAAVLWTPRDLPTTRRFYEAAGWSPDGREKTEEIAAGKPVIQIRYLISLR